MHNYPTPKLFIAGQWLDGAQLDHAEVRNPATDEVMAQVPLASTAELETAAQSALKGLIIWRAKTALERCNTLRRAAQLMRERAAHIATTLTLEQGKPLSEATREVTLSADILDFQAEEAKRLYGRTVPPRVEGILHHEVRREPIGVVAAFTAWNFPINLATRKLASALAAGCSVVLKPAENTPCSPMLLVQCFLDAGLPPECLQLVFGKPAQVSEFLIAHPAVAKVSFTGSVAVGQHLHTLCAQHGKRFSGELGGHAPVVMCADADLAFVLKQSIPAKFRNAGQVCASPIRFLVHESLYTRFTENFVQAAQALTLGVGLDKATQMGPLAHAARLEDMAQFVQNAQDVGARIACGGSRALGKSASDLDLSKGYFFQPTVITDAPPSAKVNSVEPFGPIAVISPFTHLAEAIAQANSTPYALGAYAFTKDLETAHTLSTQLHAGMVGINHFGVSQPEMPFGGQKASGIGGAGGYEMGAEGLLAYTEIKTVTVGMHR